ncbi:MAG: NAD(P)-binding domain-containing protein [Acholeplasmatales bacterium]|nr:NAD(P)-binding domain-containing protein [Acholeplasmatales bacterium]
MKAFCLNNISQVALNNLKNPDTTVADINDADSILVRSAEMKEMELGANILAVARAGAGVNNIPLEKYAKQGVVVFNTPGANANAVKELVLAAMLIASRDIIGGNNWVKENAADENIAKTAEKAKKAFGGYEILGKKVAVIGLGAIGILVANSCVALGMNVIGYDPYLSTANALKLNSKVQYTASLEDAVKDVDFVTIHVPAMDATKGMISADLIAKMNKNTIILNFSRDSLVKEDALAAALEAGNIRKYVTDFANPKSVTMKNTIVLPHLGASTEEAEDNCAVMAVEELKDFIEHGNIKNSVNYPAINAGVKNGVARICICHTNVPGVINKFTKVISDTGANINTLLSQSKGEFAYTILDTDKSVAADAFNGLEGVIRVRVI